MHVKKVFENLDLWLWLRPSYKPGGLAGPVLLNGSDPALEAVASSLEEAVRLFGRGTRRFKCNPPAGAEQRWIGRLVVAIDPAAPADQRMRYSREEAELRIPPSCVALLAEALRSLQASEKKHGYAIGRGTPWGLDLSPDWQGIE